MGFCIVGLVMMIFFVEFIITPTSESWLMWVAVGSASVCGLGAAWFTIKTQKVGFFCLGGFAGFIVGLILYDAFLV